MMATEPDADDSNPIRKALAAVKDDDADDIEVSADEILAAKALFSAKGDEARAKALKAFVKLCNDSYEETENE